MMQHTIPPILVQFAGRLGTRIQQHRVTIPPKLGKGYCAGVDFNNYIRMMILHYELHKDLIIENPDIDTSRRLILFKFQHVLTSNEPSSPNRLPQKMPAVFITTSTDNIDEVIHVHTNTHTINIEVEAGYLEGFFDLAGNSLVVQSLLRATQPLFFEQLMIPSLQKIVDEMVETPVAENFRLFFWRIKAEELVCSLLMELEKREEKHLYPLNSDDIQSIYRVKDNMLEQLETPPVINDLAAMANMSPSKLKRLFRQIFGDSIFSYYQAFRMKEAARLVKEEKLTVAQAGYRMGFTNLSHFSRVFKAHTGMNPKQYSRS